MITLKTYTMNIKETIDALNARHAELGKQNAANKEEMKKIRIKERKLQTILKHAENALTDDVVVSDHEEAEA